MGIFARNRIHILCCSFDLYGTDNLTGNQVKEWFDYCVSLSELTPYPFDEGCCTPGNTKYVLLRNCKRALEKNIHDIEGVELRSSIDVNETGSYGIMHADFSNYFKLGYFGCHYSFFDYDQLIKIGIKLCELTKPKYGIFHKLPFVLLPECYASAMGMSELDTVPGRLFNPKHVDLKERNGMWGSWHRDHEEKLYDYDFDSLREIYPINFINKNHLSHEVFPRMTLKNWIEAADHRGALSQVTDELWSWIIPDEDLYQITVDLAPTDILLCVNRENPQRYDYGARPEDKTILT
jgi:hypothetical protein